MNKVTASYVTEINTDQTYSACSHFAQNEISVAIRQSMRRNLPKRMIKRFLVAESHNIASVV